MDSEFVSKIKETITEIDTRYKKEYENYTLSKDEEHLKKFLDDIWLPKFDCNEQTERLLKSGVVTVLFICSRNQGDTYIKSFPIKKLKPARKCTTPLWYLLYHIGKINNDYSVYICPNIYLGARGNNCFSENSIIASNCYYIDIDDISTQKPVYNMTPDSIKNYLKRHYPIYGKIKPTHILMSGRGLHLYFILNRTEVFNSPQMRKTHKWLTKDLINLYGGDIVCSNLNRFMRLPFSKNTKINIPSKLIYSDVKSQHTFKDMLTVTKELNGKISKSTKSHQIQKKNVNLSKAAKGNHGFQAMISNRISDLNSWFEWHIDDMEGRRHNFFFIYANTLRNNSYSDTVILNIMKKMNSRLTKPLSEKEIENIVLNLNNYYKITNSTIADRLGFSFLEQTKLISVYSIEEKERRKIERQQEKAAEREAKREATDQIYFEYFNEHPNEKIVDMAKHLGISYCIVYQKYRKYKVKKD